MTAITQISTAGHCSTYYLAGVGSDLPWLLRRVQSRETADWRLRRMSQSDVEQPSPTLVPLWYRPLQPVPHTSESPDTAGQPSQAPVENAPPPVAATAAGVPEELLQELRRREDCSRGGREDRSAGLVSNSLDQLAGFPRRRRPRRPAGRPIRQHREEE